MDAYSILVYYTIWNEMQTRKKGSTQNSRILIKKKKKHYLHVIIMYTNEPILLLYNLYWAFIRIKEYRNYSWQNISHTDEYTYHFLIYKYTLFSLPYQLFLYTN